ncbi:MAG: hypothetical protein ABR540_22240 [Acidimicrobiales bacterium]
MATTLIGVTAVLGLSACGDDDDNAAPCSRDLVATDMLRFEPDECEITFNQEVSFTLENQDDDREHNFNISSVFTDIQGGTALSVDVPANSSREVKFTVRERPRDGFLTFRCRFHESEGMFGRITVS